MGKYCFLLESFGLKKAGSSDEERERRGATNWLPNQ